MLPLRDTIRSRTVPLINYGLILINVLVFLFELSLGSRGVNRILSSYGLVPARLSLETPLTWVTLVTSTFLHGGWFHLISNMWTLYIFGDNVEDRLGSLRYLLFYLFGGVAAGAAQVAFDPTSTIPTVGASGAIAGVLGAYFILYPRARVITLLPLFFFFSFVEIPAVIFLGLWFFSQLSSGLLSLGAAGDFGGIAWWAHIGGFLFGLLFVRIFTRRPAPPAVGFDGFAAEPRRR
ncbi:MAG TPA: rhomboid family intramembrane serine protease [Anaerolineales bacterium]|nr:rhomboid family intramembrane serine protease [Anaerolineales bacterium]